MWDKAFNHALNGTEGIFALLFIALLATVFGLVRWVLNTNNARELRYIDVINTQAEALKNFEDMRHDIKDIKDFLVRGGGRD